MARTRLPWRGLDAPGGSHPQKDSFSGKARLSDALGIFQGSRSFIVDVLSGLPGSPRGGGGFIRKRRRGNRLLLGASPHKRNNLCPGAGVSRQGTRDHRLWRACHQGKGLPGRRHGRCAIRFGARLLRQSCLEPLFVHGTKTCAYEIVEQVGWNAPDWVLVPSGSGTMLLGLHLGFHEMRGQGLIETLPRLVASQARNCNPLERFVAGKKFRSSKPTLAEGAAVARPPRVAEMARALSESRGRVYSAPEEKLLPATETCWRYGLYVEPTSALGLTALEDLAQEESLDGRKVVVIFTGSGLKFSG
ncbi:MAG: hypothetical protein DMG09_16930 [Acidobacteria bacterium]|nr:MAG: hypothetical protein DMG09_16930 [Acidobacteriota bacterium]